MSQTHAIRRLVTIVVLLGGLLVLALVLGLGPGRKHTSLADNLQTVGHFGFFALFAMLVTLAAGLVPLRVTQLPGGPYVIGLGAAVVAGSLLELAQTFVPLRMASWNDLGHDSLGAVAGIALLMAWRSRRAGAAGDRRLGYVAWLVFAVAVLLGTRQLAVCLRDYWHRRAAHPGLIAFGQQWSHRFLWIDDEVTLHEDEDLPDAWPDDARRNAVTAVFQPSQERQFPGMGVKEPYPDWRGHKVLAFDVFNPGTLPIPAGIRIHDFQHSDDYYDRFNDAVELQPGFQTIRISMDAIEQGPRDRPLDLTQVDGVKLFLIRPPAPVRLTIGNLRLE